MRRIRRALLIVALALPGMLTAVGADSAAAAPAQAAAGPSPCSRIYFIGLRGSGEAYLAAENGMGPTVNRVFEQFEQPARYYTGVEVTPVGIDYPAAAVDTLFAQNLITQQYSSVLIGQGALAKKVTEIVARHDNSCTVMVGYSQGAWAIGNLANTVALDRMHGLAGIALLGDPRFDPRAKPIVEGSLASTGIVRSGVFAGIGKVDDPYFAGLADRTRSYCHANDPVCNFTNIADAAAKCGPGGFLYARCQHLWYVPGPDQGYTDIAAAFLVDRVRSQPAAPAPQAPKIDRVETYSEGVLVYVRAYYSDADGDAVGFGFRGANGAGWAEESHPFTNPSYGRVGPGRIDYPFNHGCGTPRAFSSDVDFWIYDKAGQRSDPVLVHMKC